MGDPFLTVGLRMFQVIAMALFDKPIHDRVIYMNPRPILPFRLFSLHILHGPQHPRLAQDIPELAVNRLEPVHRLIALHLVAQIQPLLSGNSPQILCQPLLFQRGIACSFGAWRSFHWFSKRRTTRSISPGESTFLPSWVPRESRMKLDLVVR